MILGILNVVAMVLHLLAFIGLWVTSMNMGNASNMGAGLQVPVYRTQLTPNRSFENMTYFSLIPEYAPTGGQAPLTWFVLFLFLFTFLEHAMVAVPTIVAYLCGSSVANGCMHRFAQMVYYDRINECRNPLRWISYSITAPFMVYVIAYLVGVRSADLLIALHILTATTMLFGYLTEEWNLPIRYNIVVPIESNTVGQIESNTVGQIGSNRVDYYWRSKKWYVRVIPHVMGWIPYLGVWGIIYAQYSYVVESFSNSNTGQKTPSWVNFIVIGIFILFTGFALVQVATYGPVPLSPKQYWMGEVAYIILSATSKILLGTVVGVNLLFVSQPFDN